MTLETWLPTAIFVPLVGFGLYRRFKRTFGRQPFTPKRMIFRIVLLSVFVAIFLATATTMTAWAAAGGGLALGLGLGILGLAKTRFEVDAKGKWYTPNGWIGLVVTALFVGRLVARMVTVIADPAAVTGGAAAPTPYGGIQRSPLTLGVFCVMAAYYIFYNAGVLWKGRSLDGPVSPTS